MKLILKLLLSIILATSTIYASEAIPTRSEVAKLYIATFNRAPDSAGLDYWTNDAGLTLSGIAQSFFDQPETQTLYPSGTANADFITSVYENLFNRTPDSGGYDYWKAELDSGKAKRDFFILMVINGAQDGDNGMDMTILNNKNEVGLYFANAGLDDKFQAKDIMVGVTAGFTSVSTAKANTGGILSIIDNGKIITASSSNFTFAEPIWKNTPQDSNFLGSHTNYLLVNIDTAGTFQISSALAKSGSSISLLKLEGDNSAYTTSLVKNIDAGMVSFAYLQAGEYLVKANFNGQVYPHISFDFFPDGNGGSCIPLYENAIGLTCDEQWLPAHYRMDIGPWIQSQFQSLKYRVGNIAKAKEVADSAYMAIDSVVDVRSIINGGDLDIASVMTKKAGQAIAVAMPHDVEIGNIVFDSGAAFDTVIQHALIADDLFKIMSTGGVGDAQAWANVSQQFIADAESIASSISGILGLNALEERLNEVVIVRSMLETYILRNYGNWDALIVGAGLPSGSNQSMTNIINGYADKLQYSNGWFTTNYDVLYIEELFNKGIYDFGDWVSVRKTLDNPYDDVDGDGVENIQEIIDGTNPNDASSFLGNNNTNETVTITHNGTEYGTVTSPFTGRVWLDRNLGASQVCTALDDTVCVGDHYQWGRNADGHEKSNHTTTSTLATNINNAGTHFILTTEGDWTTVDSEGLLRSVNWSKIDGTSVCPAGFRVPSITELKAETTLITNNIDAFNNFLKLPSAEDPSSFNELLNGPDFGGKIWSSSIFESYAKTLIYYSSYSGTRVDRFYKGNSIRCVQDNGAQNIPPVIESLNQQLSPTSVITQEIAEGERAVFQVQAKDSDGVIVSYEWKEGTTVLSTSNIFTTFNFTVGTHTITLTVTDDDGATATGTVVVTVSADQATLINISIESAILIDANGNNLINANINENSLYAFKAIGYYSDGSHKEISPTWSDDSNYASIDSNGNLTTYAVDADTLVTILANYNGENSAIGLTIKKSSIPPVIPSSFEITEVEPNDTTSTAQNIGTLYPLLNNGYYHSHLTNEDGRSATEDGGRSEDYFSFTASNNGIVYISVVGEFDMLISLYDSNENLIASSNTSDLSVNNVEAGKIYIIGIKFLSQYGTTYYLADFFN